MENINSGVIVLYEERIKKYIKENIREVFENKKELCYFVIMKDYNYAYVYYPNVSDWEENKGYWVDNGVLCENDVDMSFEEYIVKEILE